MTPAIQQSVQFACTPKVLFEMYLDSAKHAPQRANLHA